MRKGEEILNVEYRMSNIEGNLTFTSTFKIGHSTFDILYSLSHSSFLIFNFLRLLFGKQLRKV